MYIRHCKTGVMFVFDAPYQLKNYLESKSTIHVEDETWWDGQHDRCKVQSHYTPNKGCQMKPICTHLFHSPTTTQQLAAKTTLSFCHDWFSWFSPSSNKRIRGQSLHHHCIIRNSEIVRYAKTFMARSFFILQFALVCALSIPCPWTSSFKDGPAVIHIYDGGRRLLVMKWKFAAYYLDFRNWCCVAVTLICSSLLRYRKIRDEQRVPPLDRVPADQQ